uniref:Uncharacterized protein n=2 Tax=Cacopsylla melanoneura TaxID=428564 RepID=A0A8D8WPH4_9HEMI
MFPPSQPMFPPNTQINPGLSHLDPLVNAHLTQALAQAQYVKSHQDAMLMNQLAAHQFALKPPNMTHPLNMNGHTQTLIPAPSPNALMSPPLNAKTNNPNIPAHISLPTVPTSSAGGYYPAQFQIPLNMNMNPHLMQPMASQSPMFFVNMPRMPVNQQQAMLNKFPLGLNQAQTLYTFPPQGAVVQNIQQNNMFNIKRSWDQAFTGLASDGSLPKRPNTSATSTLYTSPPPATVSTSAEHLGFPTAQYYPAL